MSRIDQIHNDYLDPDKHLASEQGDDDSPSKLDAYGHLTWTVGDDDWFACFDALRVGTEIHYHVVVNCESGGWIDTLETGTVRITDTNAIANMRQLPSYWVDMYYNQDKPKRIYWKKTAKRWSKHIDELLKKPALCKHCQKFQSLGRICTAATHGECDCPKCQGFCECN